jgi:hypothetical protein
MAIEANIQQNPTVAQNATTEGPIVLTVTGIINDLNDGIDRDGIATKYGLSKSEVTELFKHPKLVGLRARKKIAVRFTLVDDTIVTKSDLNQLEQHGDVNQMDLLDAIQDHQAATEAISN